MVGRWPGTYSVDAIRWNAIGVPRRRTQFMGRPIPQEFDDYISNQSEWLSIIAHRRSLALQVACLTSKFELIRMHEDAERPVFARTGNTRERFKVSNSTQL